MKNKQGTEKFNILKRSKRQIFSKAKPKRYRAFIAPKENPNNDERIRDGSKENDWHKISPSNCKQRQTRNNSTNSKRI